MKFNFNHYFMFNHYLCYESITLKIVRELLRYNKKKCIKYFLSFVFSK